MAAERTEHDFIGEVQLPASALYGIQAHRARANFSNSVQFNFEWYRAVALVKLTFYRVYERFADAVAREHPRWLAEFGQIPEKELEALIAASTELADGKHFKHFIVPAHQGGAGTSINMNVNEIICNRALELMGQELGNYRVLDPVLHANIFQSTNDVIPTALRVAAMRQLEKLEENINKLRQRIEQLETKHRDTLRNAYTQLQAAVPSSYGYLFSAYSEMLSRDWWRISKCFERIKTVNLGGSAVGTAMGVPRFFVMELVSDLQKLSGLPLSRSENMVDATQNLDSWVEIHAILKAHAVNLEKMSSDLRLLASDFSGKPDMQLPKMQVGSSIMPGKVNPVIAEYAITVAHRVYANDMLVSGLAGQGQLDLNAYLPEIGHAVLQSIDLLISANESLLHNLIAGLHLKVDNSESKTLKNSSLAAALSPYIGYHRAAEIARVMREKQCSVFEANEQLKLLSNEKLKQLLSVSNLLKGGFSVKDYNLETGDD